MDDYDFTLAFSDWLGVEATLSRMRELGFEFEHGNRRDGLDWVIRPQPTDPAAAAEVGKLFAAFTGPDVDSYLLQLEHLLFGEAFNPDIAGDDPHRPPAGMTWGYLLPSETEPPTAPRLAWRPGDDDGLIPF